ncbi:Uncharacterized conserved protein [Yoonia rosea]|uniref:Uncharacterized conserved protein n=1 Tax=Yoonia rosea TaxID=287098 RepID=A0A1R3WDN6_9RHOB|nr:transporter [Yoonia rosea]SIT76301.1 Uncharacterized conserved protein [Yoonia rosea]
MKKLTKFTARSGACAALALVCATSAVAREPGVLPTIPPGASMGVPIAGPTPVDGIFVSSRSGLSDQTFYDDDGNETPTELTIRDTVLQFAIVPGQQVLGGEYRAFLTVPFIDVEGENIATPFGPVDAENSGVGSMEIRPIDIAWEITPGAFLNAGVSFHTPTGWDAAELVNPGQNFWTISPSVGYSYLRDGWNASAHLLYFANLENEDNGYTSGDEVMLNLTAMKDVGNDFSAGAVGYWRQQITDDENPDAAYGGFVAERSASAGVGLSVTKQLGPVNLNAMYTTDVLVENTGGGDRFWFNVIVPIAVFGQ